MIRQAILFATVLMLLTGCAAMEPNRTEATVRSAAAAVPTLPAAVPTEDEPIREAEAILPREEAERIALEYAGFTVGQVKRLRVEFETDDGIRQYAVSFLEGQREYEFEIDARTGKILSCDVDPLRG